MRMATLNIMNGIFTIALLSSLPPTLSFITSISVYKHNAPHWDILQSTISNSISDVQNPTSPLGNPHEYNYSPLFDFTVPASSFPSSAYSAFERIDDAIMGGISTSTLRPVPSQPYASWSGVCRTDGGGFCGVRTKTFEKPFLVPPKSKGLYLDGCLVSDEEEERRIWKMTLRTDPASRGEMLYQAMFRMPSSSSEQGQQVRIPFDKFQLVRGPRLVPGAAPLDVSEGISQVGLSLSKFVVGESMKELENFRAGFFEVHLKQIGVYEDMENSKDNNEGIELGNTKIQTPVTLSDEEVKKKRPVMMNAARTVAKLIFSEKRNRRKQAVKLLRTKRQWSALKVALFGIRIRSKGIGLLPAIFRAARVSLGEVVGFVVQKVFTVCVFYPLLTISKVIKNLRKGIPTEN